MPFFVQDYAHDFTAATDTPRKALAEAVDWHVVKRRTRVTISDGVRRYSISVFVSAMASLETTEKI